MSAYEKVGQDRVFPSSPGFVELKGLRRLKQPETRDGFVGEAEPLHHFINGLLRRKTVTELAIDEWIDHQSL